MPREPRNTGFWGRVEAWLMALQDDPERAARLVRVIWILSVLMILVGFAIMAYVLVLGGSWPP